MGGCRSRLLTLSTTTTSSEWLRAAEVTVHKANFPLGRKHSVNRDPMGNSGVGFELEIECKSASTYRIPWCHSEPRITFYYRSIIMPSLIKLFLPVGPRELKTTYKTMGFEEYNEGSIVLMMGKVAY
jgi:hypothetical protein